MSDQQDIEQLLQAMRPATPDPALRERIADSLAVQAEMPSHSGSFRYRLAVGLAVAAVVVIAGLVVLQFATPSDKSLEVVTDLPPANQEGEVVPPSAVTDQPTLLALHHALRESPQEVDALLDRINADRLDRLASNSRPVFASIDTPDLYKDLP